MKSVKILTETYLRLHSELENENDEVQQEVFDLEQEVEEQISCSHPGEINQLKSLLKKIKIMKREFDLYDEEAELDMMFPDRHEDDFDEDSMSYDSVFGKD
jgi:hypothetical protein